MRAESAHGRLVGWLIAGIRGSGGSAGWARRAVWPALALLALGAFLLGLALRYLPERPGRAQADGGRVPVDSRQG